MLKKVAVVVPFYRHSLSAYEQIALRQCKLILSSYPVIAVKPEHLTLPDAAKVLPFAETISFDNHYFESIAGYNHLMLSADFYQKFLDYEYILIYQPDAFVFSDQLMQWCSRNIDYVGAPWLREIDHSDVFKALKSSLRYYFHTRFNVQKNGLPSPMQFENRVGNGGFSLRRVKKFYDIVVSRQADIQKYLSKTDTPYFNEDAFWSVEVNRKKKALNIPSYKTGAAFAFETVPERALRINQQQLPFGCHAWDKHTDFWRPYFKQFGYDI